MSLDESIFHRLHRAWTQRRARRRAAQQYDLVAQQPRLQHLLRLVAGCDLDLVLGSGSSVAGERVVLPESMLLGAGAEVAAHVAKLRIVLAAAADRAVRCGQLAADPGEPATAHERSRAALPLLRDWLLREWPGTSALFAAAERQQQFFAARGNREFDAVFGSLPRADATRGATPAVASVDRVDRQQLPQGTERKKRRRSDAERVELPENDDGQNPLAHVFEKVRTAEEHRGGKRAPDGSDELADHQEALDELDLRSVVRSRSRAQSVFRAEVDFGGAAPDLVDEGPPPVQTYSYDEWDERRRQYLRAWCTVAEAPVAAGDAERAAVQVAEVRAAHAATLRRLRAEFRRLLRGRAPMRRQATGSEVDVDAVVDRHGELHAAGPGHPVQDDGRLYVERRPSRRDVAVVLLFDRSLSSDSWVAGRRVLEVTRNAVCLLGDAMAGVQLPVEVAAFCSHTRRDCRYDVLKSFDAPWRRLPGALFGLEPDGYTRIGPALRHAAHRLSQRSARHRLLIVLSDCKPVDHDHYEGRRGIGDVRQAMREARRAGVDTVALTIDAAAGPHLATMFGVGGFRVVSDTARLAEALAGLHERLLRR